MPRDKSKRAKREVQASERSAVLTKPPLPPASVEKARKAFGNFTLSKFRKNRLPTNHVGEGKDASAVHAVQRDVISEGIKTLNDNDAPDEGMTIALPLETMKQMLSSYDDEAGTVELDDLLSAMTKRMSGTEFYCNGNPTLNRLALQAKVDQLILSVKGKAAKE